MEESSQFPPPGSILNPFDWHLLQQLLAQIKRGLKTFVRSQVAVSSSDGTHPLGAKADAQFAGSPFCVFDRSDNCF